MPTYTGSCHCKAVRFTLECDTLTECLRCNCSICTRKGAAMSTGYFGPDAIEVTGLDALSVYRWGDRIVNNWFCRTCGIYPFHDLTTKPGHYRVNLGCVDGVDVWSLKVTWVDGRSW